MPQHPTQTTSAAASPKGAGQRQIAFRSIEEVQAADREAMRAEARRILVRLLVLSCMERRKAAA